MYESCMYDIFEQCFHDCPNCPIAQEEPDPDELYERYRDMMNERE